MVIQRKPTMRKSINKVAAIAAPWIRSSKRVYGRHAIPRISAFFKVPFNVFSNRAI